MLEKANIPTQYMNLQTRDANNAHVMLSKEFYELGNGWRLDKIDEASQVIRNLGAFFKRFSSILIKAYLAHFEVKTFKANRLIMIPKDHAVVLAGGFLRQVSNSLAI